MVAKHKLLFLLIILSIFSCKKESELDSIILALNTKELKEQYLAKLFDVDQEVRNPDKKLEILQKNNFDMQSEDFKNYGRKMMHTDSVNFIKVQKYLKIHGYPSFKSGKAGSAINTVFMHQPLRKQLTLFPYMHKAYKDNYISSKYFSFMLNRMYMLKYKKSHPQAITEEKNIEELLKELQIN